MRFLRVLSLFCCEPKRNEPPSTAGSCATCVKAEERQRTEREKQKLDDLLKRLDHHAFVLRNTPSDFFKTSVLIQASTLFAMLTLIISKGAAIAGSSSKASALSGHVPNGLVFPIKMIMVTLGFGVALSILGYAVSYLVARSRTKDLRFHVDNYLERGYAIPHVPHHFFNNFVSIFVIAALLQIGFLLFAVAWFIEFVFELI